MLGLQAKRHNGQWAVTAKDEIDGRTLKIAQKPLSTPQRLRRPAKPDGRATGEHQHVFSKGAHLIVDKLVNSKRILAFFASDRRLFFVIPEQKLA